MIAPANITTDWITALASVGAAVGTVGAVAVALWRSRPDRPHLYMECISETLIDDPTAPAYLNVRVTNRGTRPASLQYPPFFVAERRVNKLRSSPGIGSDRTRSTRLPVLLHDGESADFRFDHGQLIEAVHEPQEGVLLYATVVDQFGTQFYVPAPGVRMRGRRFRKAPKFEHSGVFLRGGPLAKYVPTSSSESPST